ncbi:MAG TPA: phosphotransferase [Flavipsychrobacter sp.]|nr:phosphotransferase [Flavipsychrobacter sp.]
MFHFPVTESTLSAAHLQQLLIERYRLGNGAKCTLFRTGMNHLYQVADGDKRYVLRVYTFNWRTKKEVTEELRLLLHLKNNNIRVAYPIRDINDGYLQDIAAPEGTRYAVLFSYAEGEKNPRFSTATSYHIGVAMAKMHQAAQGFVLERIHYNADTLLIESLRRTKLFFNTPSKGMGFVEQLTKYLESRYAQVNDDTMRSGAIHLDMWFDNMHVKGESEVTFYDFDFCGNGWLCHDISYFLYQLYNTNQEEGAYQEKFARFLAGYESVIKLTDEEKKFLPFGALGIMLFYISMQCDRYDTWSNIFLNEDHLNRLTGSLNRWMDFNNIRME